MRKRLISLSVLFVLCLNCFNSIILLNTAYAQQKPIPSYAKWGTLATKMTQEKYPNARIIDYLHIGRISGPNSSTERFKLWLKDNRKEFGVFVNIEFNKETEKVIKVTFTETAK
ncbi:MAG: DUF3889 domain-containing protein [Neobacillus sp.]